MSAPIIQWTDGWKYRLEAELTVTLGESFASAPIISTDEFRLDGRQLTIYEGYLWDGASGPTFDSPSSMAPSLVHDTLCYACRQGLLDWQIWRDDIDREFKAMLLAYGMDPLRAEIWYSAVRLFGEAYTVPQAERTVKQYPN